MIKKNSQLIINLFLFLGIVIAIGLSFQSRRKLVFIDTNLLLQEYQGLHDARIEYEKQAKKWQENVDSLVTEWQKELEEYEKRISKLSKQEKQLQEEILNNKREKILKYKEAINQKSVEEEQKIRTNLVNEVNELLFVYGREKNYDIVFGANGSGNIIYAKKVKDKTQEALAYVQKKYKEK